MNEQQTGSTIEIRCPGGLDTVQVIQRLADYVKLPPHMIWLAVLAQGFEGLYDRFGPTPLGYACHSEAARLQSYSLREIEQMEGDNPPF